MNLFTRAVLLTFTLLALTFCASANTLVTFDNGGSYTNGSQYVGPYNLTVNGLPVLGPCISFNNEVYNGETWEANIVDFSNVSTVPGMSKSLFQESVWLDQQFNGTNEAAVQQALWDINGAVPQFTDGSPTTVGSTEWYVSQAIANSSTVNADNYALLVPIDGTQSGGYGTPQSFLITPPVPEPATLMLIGTGLIVLGYVGKKRRKA